VFFYITPCFWNEKGIALIGIKSAPVGVHFPPFYDWLLPNDPSGFIQLFVQYWHHVCIASSYDIVMSQKLSDISHIYFVFKHKGSK
jgi:hypothetical protein